MAGEQRKLLPGFERPDASNHGEPVIFEIAHRDGHGRCVLDVVTRRTRALLVVKHQRARGGCLGVGRR